MDLTRDLGKEEFSKEILQKFDTFSLKSENSIKRNHKHPPTQMSAMQNKVENGPEATRKKMKVTPGKFIFRKSNDLCAGKAKLAKTNQRLLEDS